MLVLGSPGQLLTAYSNNADLDVREELVVDIPYSCPSNGTSATWFWEQVTWPRPGALGPAKIRGGYDYREPYMRPTNLRPHSVCPGDCFMSKDEQGAAETAEIADLVYR